MLFCPLPLVILLAASSCKAEYLDRWNYYGTEQRKDDHFDFGPEDWQDIVCDETNGETLDQCLAYIDKWHTGRGWKIEDNYCLWCPEGGNDCGIHHQSPIDLLRDGAIEGHENENECLDLHWMKYEDSFCTEDQLIAADAFTVERHALRVSQPITVFEDQELQIDCENSDGKRRFGRIDFSTGFSQWWYLSHIDFHTPSEHTQEGKRYDGEIQLQHFYSVSGQMAGVNNEMAVVSVFLEAYEDAPPYRYLDKLICRWRRHEFLVRDECGLAPIESNYPGCFPYKRRHLGDGIRRRADKKKSPFQTVHDVILHNDRNLKLGKNVSGLPRLIMDDINWGPPEEKDWDAWIEQESEKLKHDDRAYKSILEDQKKSSAGGKNDYDYAAAHESFRKLLGGDEIEWFNYFPMLGVRTEYYYRYSGSQTIPPCYGNFLPESQKETNHWRVMKDPIRIHPRQLQEMRRLIADRVAPIESKVNACKPDTAAKVKKDGYVEAARPLQSFNNNTHFKVFCQCKDWRSKWPEDRDWCSIDDITERFYDNPYNFKSNGF